MKCRSFFTMLAMITLSSLYASDIRISELQLVYDNSKPSGPANGFVTFTIQWNNAWHNERNHDAAWVFLNVRINNSVQALPVLIAAEGHQLVNAESALNIRTVTDKAGVFLLPPKNFRGSISSRVQIRIDTSSLRRYFSGANSNTTINVHALEMVYIPSGKYFIGDTSRQAYVDYNAFYKSDDAGNPAGYYEVTHEETSIPVGPGNGMLYYKTAVKKYQGDKSGPIGPKFPKGYQAFYIMKYELSQGEYTTFLNLLDQESLMSRVPFMGPEYYKGRGSIRMKDSISFEATFPKRPMNWCSWDDGMAYADYSRLRPMTELEFIKASRGPQLPRSGEFVWGTNNKQRLSRYIDPNGNLVFGSGIDEKELNDNNRDVYGASYYWVMDLNGSVWERCVTPGDSIGRAFTGTHGDGRLDHGFATNTDWPKGSNEVGGFGFRGGGYYTERNNDVHVPHSPIEYRRYGSWAGGYRVIAYGQRFVRTAEW